MALVTGLTGLTRRTGRGGGDVQEVMTADLVEERRVACVPLELGVLCLDLGEEVAGGDVVAGLDVLDDGAQGVSVDARRCDLAGLP